MHPRRRTRTVGPREGCADAGFLITTRTGAQMPREQRMWTFSERQYVKAEYQRLGAVRLAQELGRSVWSIKHAARKMRVVTENHCSSRWTNDRKQAFCDLYKRDPDAACRRFGLTPMSANSYASRWGAVARKRFSAQEDELIRSLWPEHRDDELRAATGRTDSALRTRAHRLGLRRPAVHDWMKDFRFSEVNQ